LERSTQGGNAPHFDLGWVRIARMDVRAAGMFRQSIKIWMTALGLTELKGIPEADKAL
jgi:hypothetical protein